MEGFSLVNNLSHRRISTPCYHQPPVFLLLLIEAYLGITNSKPPVKYHLNPISFGHKINPKQKPKKKVNTGTYSVILLTPSTLSSL